ncbi:MAG: DUF4956 domain-containing protein [Ruminococcus sp.]|nr:DUF4956 domain-containing protein [Ruminococcus sp.]
MLNNLLTINAASTDTTTLAAVSNKEFLICSLVSLGLGLVIAFAFAISNKAKQTKKSKGFLMTLALLPVIVQVVIMMVNGNIGTGVAVMGAFGLVRFRSAPGSAEDICAIFLAMAVGLATGTDQLAVAAMLAVGVGLIYIIYSFIPIGNSNKQLKQLTVTIPESLDYDGAFDDIFNTYTSSHELVSVKTTNMGSLFKLKYEVTFNSSSDEKKLIDEIRTRNGNLEIMCARASDEITQVL